MASGRGDGPIDLADRDPRAVMGGEPAPALGWRGKPVGEIAARNREGTDQIDRPGAGERGTEPATVSRGFASGLGTSGSRVCRARDRRELAHRAGGRQLRGAGSLPLPRQQPCRELGERRCRGNHRAKRSMMLERMRRSACAHAVTMFTARASTPRA